MSDHWQKCNVCGHLKQRATPGGCPKGHVGGFSYADSPEVCRIEAGEPMIPVSVQMRKYRTVAGVRIPLEPDVLLARIVQRHPKQAMVLVEPEGWAHAVWVGLDDFVEGL